MENEIFEECKKISDLIDARELESAREFLIRLLSNFPKSEYPYPQLINQLLRETGLFGYIVDKSANVQEKLISNLFKVYNGEERVTLHREQSRILKKLLNNESLVLSAPTSFGKSFIIDAFIALRSPNNIVIIVPTIALMDEMRRRIHKKFSYRYNIITSSNEELAENNILIFPQERALYYTSKLEKIDLLIVDEFYKSSGKFDKTRSDSLNRAIINLSKKSSQRYYLTPNIKKLENNPLTKGMEFIDSLNFKTVVLDKHETFKNINANNTKEDELVSYLSKYKDKTIIYAGTYSEIGKISEIVKRLDHSIRYDLLNDFSDWLERNYSKNWILSDLVKKGTGVHNGRIHRSLSQIQVKLFEETNGLINLIVTSSIIEGVNTSAKNIIFWKNRNGLQKLDEFSYKNLEGRAGRSFKYFVGNIFLYEEPPELIDTSLEIEVSQEVLPFIDNDSLIRSYSQEEVAEITKKKMEIQNVIGQDNFEHFFETGNINFSKATTVTKLIGKIRNGYKDWFRLNALNSDESQNWHNALKNFYFMTGKDFNHTKDLLGMNYDTIIKFILKLSDNWKINLNDQIREMSDLGFNTEQFFELERYVTNVLSSYLADVNTICVKLHNGKIDFSKFIHNASNAFLPSSVYKLEEYGLPRTISKKLSDHNLIDFEQENVTFKDHISFIRERYDTIISLDVFDKFDKYILKYFHDGISLNNIKVN